MMGLFGVERRCPVNSYNAPPGIGGGMRGGGDTKLHRSPNGVRTPAGSKETNIVRELTVALAHSQAARSLHSGGRPVMDGKELRWDSARQWLA